MPHTRQVRADSWVKQLTQDQQHELYETTKQPNMNGTKAIQWAVKEFGLKKIPSQTAFYQWKVDMCKAECQDRVIAVAIATSRFHGLVPDDEIVATFKVLATEAALSGDAKTAATFAKCAAMLHDCYVKQREFDQKEQDRQKEVLRNLALAPYTDKLLKEYNLMMDKMILDDEKKLLAKTTPSVQPAANPPAPADGTTALTEHK